MSSLFSAPPYQPAMLLQLAASLLDSLAWRSPPAKSANTAATIRRSAAKIKHGRPGSRSPIRLSDPSCRFERKGASYRLGAYAIGRDKKPMHPGEERP
jgi:hypothetical protein